MPNQSELTEGIARRLDASGYGEWAKRLRDALFGSTGTEINMALAHTLHEFLKSKPKVDKETKELIKKLQRETSEALRWK